MRSQWLICCSAARVTDSQAAPGEQDRQPRHPSKSLEHWTQTRLPLSIFRGKVLHPGATLGTTGCLAVRGLHPPDAVASSSWGRVPRGTQSHPGGN